jgi:phosphoribosylanthranilate isomerase
VIVKICGLRSEAHALAAADAGADLLGFILAPSRRQVSIGQVAQIRTALERHCSQGARRPELVGVFVNASALAIRAAVSQGGLDLIQLSGDEPIAWREQLDGLQLIKAVRLTDSATEQEWIAHSAAQDQVRLLVDAHVPGSYGGAGIVANWASAAALARRAAILLAGGLTPENVGAAVREVRPWGVDVSSGVETDGAKDIAKIRTFIAAARSA